MNITEQTLKHFLHTQKVPKLSGQFQNMEKCEYSKLSQILQTQLRLAYIKEAEEEIRQICTEYMDVFKLPGDRPTATLATQHHIPTHIPANRAITLRNHRIPEQHKKSRKPVNQVIFDI